MTGNGKFIARVKLARVRMRDVAAGAASVAEIKLHQARVEETERGEARERLSAGLPRQLMSTQKAGTLLLLEAERQHAKREEEEAIARVRAAAEESGKRRAILQRRERELRGCEKALDRTIAARNAADKRREQEISDDMIGARIRSAK